ncbi:MAG: hypothetical protein WDN49_13145 [Acetobacteraceae bacterium]
MDDAAFTAWLSARTPAGAGDGWRNWRARRSFSRLCRVGFRQRADHLRRWRDDQRRVTPGLAGAGLAVLRQMSHMHQPGGEAAEALPAGGEHPWPRPRRASGALRR